MRTLLQAIGEIIRPELRRDGTICLQEDDPGSRCGPVTLHKSGQALVLKLDGIPGPLCRQQGCQLRYAVNDRMFPLFDHHKEGLTSSCDYIIFYQDQQKGSLRVRGLQWRHAGFEVRLLSRGRVPHLLALLQGWLTLSV